MGYTSILRENRFADQIYIVTGGSGRCVAHGLAGLGAHVVITGEA